DHDPVIHVAHLEEAVELWNSLVFDMPETMEVSSSSPETTDMKVIQDMLERIYPGCLQRADLQRRLSARGLNKDRLDKAMETLLDQETVKEEREPGVRIGTY